MPSTPTGAVLAADVSQWSYWPGLKVAMQTASINFEAEQVRGKPVQTLHADPVNHLQIPYKLSKSGGGDVATHLVALQQLATQMRESSADRACMLQIATQVEHTFISILGAPKYDDPKCWWRPTSSEKRRQRLELLEWVSREYSAVTCSVPLHADMQAPRLLTHALIMLAFFQVVRTPPPSYSPGSKPTKEDEVLPHLIEKRFHAFNSKLASSRSGRDLYDVLRRCEFLRPELLEARHSVLMFVSKMDAALKADEGAAVQPAFLMDLQFKEQSQCLRLSLREKEAGSGPFFEFIKEARALYNDVWIAAGKPESRNPNLKEKDAVPTEFERLASWLLARHEKGFDYQLLRDMLIRYYLGVQHMQPSSESKEIIEHKDAKVDWTLSFTDEKTRLEGFSKFTCCKSSLLPDRVHFTPADCRFYLRRRPPPIAEKKESWDDEFMLTGEEAKQDHVLHAVFPLALRTHARAIGDAAPPRWSRTPAIHNCSC